MSYELFVEISEELDPGLRDQLLALSYRASRWQAVAIVLRGVSRDEADRRLDPVVESEGAGLPGVRYLEVEDAEALLGELGANGARRPVVLTRERGWIPRSSGGDPEVHSPEVGIEMLKERVLAARFA